MALRIAVVGIAALCSVAASHPRSLMSPPSAHGRAVVSVAQGMKWTATLAPQGDSKVNGTATVEGKGSATDVEVMITGAAPGATYPWHVHTGKCGGGGVWGDPSAYKPLKAGSDGTAKGSATIKQALPLSGDFHVNVHSPTSMTPVACGDLKMSGM